MHSRLKHAESEYHATTLIFFSSCDDDMITYIVSALCAYTGCLKEKIYYLNIVSSCTK